MAVFSRHYSVGEINAPHILRAIAVCIRTTMRAREISAGKTEPSMLVYIVNLVLRVGVYIHGLGILAHIFFMPLYCDVGLRMNGIVDLALAYQRLTNSLLLRTK